MTKDELMKAISEESGLLKKDCDSFLNAFTNTIKKSLSKGNDVKLIGFGTFNVRDRAARTGSNPRTGDEIAIAACKVPGFKAGSELKKAVNV